MNSSKEMQKEIRSPEELERLKKEEGEIKDEKTGKGKIMQEHG